MRQVRLIHLGWHGSLLVVQLKSNVRNIARGVRVADNGAIDQHRVKPMRIRHQIVQHVKQLARRCYVHCRVRVREHFGIDFLLPIRAPH